MDVSSALNSLRSARLEDLRLFRDEVLSTLNIMEQRLKSAASAESEAISSPANSSPNCDRSSAPLNEGSEVSDEAQSYNTDVPRGRIPEVDGKKKDGSDKKGLSKDRSLALLKGSLSSWPSVWQLAQGSQDELVVKKRGRQRDRRLDDILRVEGQNEARDEDLLFRAAAQRSLAVQYSSSQEYRRVNEIYDFLLGESSSEKNPLHKRRAGDVRLWVSDHLTSDDKEVNTLARSTQAGIKQLVAEKLLDSRLQQTSPTSRSSGLSTILAMNMRTFKALPFEELPYFLDRLFEESSRVDLPCGDQYSQRVENTEELEVRSCHVVETFGKLSRWFEAFQIKYELVSCISDNTPEDLPRPPKQSRIFDPSLEGNIPNTAEIESALDEILDNNTTQPAFDPLYNPRFNIQPVDPLYDPRFNIQPVYPLYDPRYNIQPIQTASTPQVINFDALNRGNVFPDMDTMYGDQQSARVSLSPSTPFQSFHYTPQNQTVV